MLVEFSVENYKSYGSKQVFSMSASAGAKRRDSTSFQTGNSYAPSLLRSAVIFGPNAAGKSSLIEAVDFFTRFVENSAKERTQGEPIKVTPNQLIAGYRSLPTEMEIVFINDGTMFQYGFKLDRTRVFEEWLFSRSNQKGSRNVPIFQREYSEEKQKTNWYINDNQVKGEKETWKSSTRDNALFLSTAVQLNSEYFKEPFGWIQRHLNVIRSPQRLHFNSTAAAIYNKKFGKQLKKLLDATDLDIQRFDVNQVSMPEPSKEVREVLSSSAMEQLEKAIKDAKEYKVKSIHLDDSGQEIEFDLSQESDGTQVLFSLAGPLTDVLSDGDTLFVDELNNSLHPTALKFLVDLFHNPEINTKSAQLIFTSHDSSVVSNQFMHKDQIWFVEKEDSRQTFLYPLSDFKVRDVDSFQRSYLGGKFGAIPSVGFVPDASAE